MECRPAIQAGMLLTLWRGAVLVLNDPEKTRDLAFNARTLALIQEIDSSIAAHQRHAVVQAE